MPSEPEPPAKSTSNSEPNEHNNVGIHPEEHAKGDIFSSEGPLNDGKPNKSRRKTST